MRRFCWCFLISPSKQSAIFRRCYSLLVTSITQAMGEISGHLKDVLVEFKVPDAEQDELSAIIQSLQPAIVDRPDEKKLNKDVPADR